ncbi:MAG TPA: HAMP domain-containing sensor histidine kinase [Acidimicrobiales bacterium]|nr:HAMP domain-containing sensor histidine kinase [Acidimicrobiales bacterium]
MTAAWRRTPLWLRLIAAVLALAFVGLTLTGAFGARLLRGYLVARVDEQVTSAAAEVRDDLADGIPSVAPYPSSFHVTIVDRRGAGVMQSRSILTPSVPDLPDLDMARARDLAGRPFTVDATTGDDSWRAVVLPFRDGSASVVVATSLDEVEATVDRLVHIDLIVGLAVLAGLAVAGYSMVRTALRPLEEIELTAAAIGRGDLGRRVPDHDPTTELGRLSRALNAMLEQIERAFGARAASEARARRSEQRMRQFVADASHELRTPLTSIRGFAELHRQGAVTDAAEVSQLLGRIEDEATRMALLVDDLLLLARLDQERPLRAVPVDLIRVAEGTVAAARVTAPDREIVLAVDRPATPEERDGDLVVPGDESRLRQVITNLLDNALAYSPSGTPVSVRLARVERDGRPLAAVEVVDRGPGLTPEQADRVFERFYRTDAARSRARGGTGLGLSIVAAIVTAHGGTVEVDTAPGEGATFRVLLPRAPAPAAGPPPSPAAEPDTPPATQGAPAASG